MKVRLWSLRPIRVLLEMSQLELSQRSGLPQPRVSDLELGKRANDGEVKKLAAALGLNADILRANAVSISRTGRVWKQRG